MRAKKSLGQHFLNSPAYLWAIVDAAQLKKGETVVEVGPGKGSLTAEILSRGAQVVAIEKDARMIPLLREKFAQEIERDQLQIIEQDILLLDTTNLGLHEGRYALVGNIPYYITGALFEKFLGSAPRPKTVVFLTQKEVAMRIARSPKESILSLSVKAYGVPKYIKTVPRGAFSPVPGVDSAILAIYNISRKHFKNTGHEKWFFELLHAGFGHKRKFLVRNLELLLGSTDIHRAFAELKIPEKSRAEDLSPAQWLALSSK